jgi:hypothetical protein
MVDQITRLSLLLCAQTATDVFMLEQMATPTTLRCSLVCRRFNHNPDDGADKEDRAAA